MATFTRIGNSHGLRIPQRLIKQTRLEGKKVTFEVLSNGLLIKSAEQKPRAGWAEWADAFRKTKGKKDEGLLEDVLNHEADIPDWEW